MTNRKTKKLCDPAYSVVREFGGVNEVARIAGVAKVQVYRWMWTVPDGGTGGVIPSRRAQMLFEWAKENGKAIAAESFFERVA